MSARAARWWLAAAVMLAALLTLASVIEFNGIVPILGVWGCTFGAGDQPYRVRVISVDEEGPAARAGLRAGDSIDLRHYELLDRIGILQAPIAGRPVHLALQRNGRVISAVVVPTSIHIAIPRALRISNRTYHGGLLLMCLFAALIAWRRYDRRDARILSLMLSTFVIGETSSAFDLVTPWPAVSALLEFVTQIAYVAPIALFVVFASGVQPTLSRTRKITQALTYVAVAAALTVSVGIAVGETLLWIDPVGLFYKPIWTLPQNAAYIGALVCAALAFSATRGVERQLVGWAGFSAALLFLSQIIASLGEEYATTYAGYTAYEIVGNTGVFAGPIGLSYALLNRRLLDIGFVLNRAAVFTIVSLIIVGSFVVAEWALSEWIRDASHLTSAAVNITLALALGFSIRAIESRVDHFVDLVFFRKRYENEQALRDFAHEAAYITNASALLERTVKEVQEHAEASGVSIVLADDEAIDPDDEAMVAMRAFHKPLELRKYKTALHGEYAFPMSSRGRLLGALICGLKRGGETYAPDEFSAITEVAHSVGAALDTMRSEDKGAFDTLLATQQEILETLQGIRASLMPREVL